MLPKACNCTTIRPRTAWLLWLLVLLVCAGCGQPIEQATQPNTTPVATETPADKGTFQNPVLQTDFPDPGMIKVGDIYYAYATNVVGKHIQVARSRDLVTWEQLHDALPALPPWSLGNGLFVWAPEVIQIGNQFVLYYTTRDRQADKQCIGVATSATPEGPFRDTSTEALVCQADQGGSIDPSPFRDGEKLYLYWKNDGNCCSKPTYLYGQELATDGLGLLGQPTRLVRNDQPWEGQLVEAPTMAKHGDSYFLFFSANAYDSPSYAVGYATCQTVIGPCVDAPENPILGSQVGKADLVIGPGHQTIVQIGDQTWLVYHAWEITANRQRGDRRFLWIDKLTWEDGKPHVHGPTTAPQPRP